MTDEELQQSFDQLAELEIKMASVDREVEKFRIEKSGDLFKQRRDVVKQMPKFWYIALAEHEDFVELILVEDLKYLEDISDIYVEYDGIDNFSITIEFEGEFVPKQTVTKKFTTKVEDGEEIITSEAVDVQWPMELEEINPVAIKKEKGTDLSKEDKKKYREGMRSFFAWFGWTGEKEGKEFREGEELTRVLAQDVFVNGVKYYTMALQDGDEEDDDLDDDSSEGEELDLGEGDEERSAKRAKTE